MPKKIEKGFNALNSLDVLLTDILDQIKLIARDEKEAAYPKLIELFFKGIDLREKIINPKKQEINDPECSIIKGIDQDMI